MLGFVVRIRGIFFYHYYSFKLSQSSIIIRNFILFNTSRAKFQFVFLKICCYFSSHFILSWLNFECNVLLFVLKIKWRGLSSAPPQTQNVSCSICNLNTEAHISSCKTRKAVNGHKQTTCKSDAKPKHSADHTVGTALLSPLVIISLTLTPFLLRLVHIDRTEVSISSVWRPRCDVLV